ncbi:MAG TPA: YbaB/EbfC family nucleoid-associated protein [Chlamydiales bacterium]|nr:YbaB/EbfC family nucleoid-associated protein [Chlamydiales bacterium]
MGSGFLKKKKQARMMQEQFSQMQEVLGQKLELLEVIGQAGNGLVEITMNGSNEMKKIRIKPECVDKEDIEGLEALIKAAHNDAVEKVKAETENGSFGGGMPDLASMLQF